MTRAGRPADPALRDVVLLAVGVGGLALCITLVYETMRIVMDVGGACADGGPYVSVQPCPDGSPGAMLVGIFGLFGFGALGMVAGARVGGYGWLPLLAWTGLFASLGWNFIDYGLVNPPEGEGIVWGWLIPGVLFELMAWGPVVFVVATLREARRGSVTMRQASTSSAGSPAPRPAVPARPLPGPGQPAHRTSAPPETARLAELREIDALLGAVVADAAADTPADPLARLASRAATTPGTEAGTAAAGGPGSGALAGAGQSGLEADFSEGTQALLDRLERLADMRDRGLLTPAEYETTKDAVMHELEAR